MIYIKRIKIGDNPHLFNTNNHLPMPDNYAKVIAIINAKNWIHLFHDVITVFLNKKDVSWMKEAHNYSGSYTKKFPHAYDDELEDMVDRYIIPETEDKNWFVRTDKVSLKYGCHGVGPYGDFKHIIESIVTCPITHNSFNISLIDNDNNDDDNVMPIYFIPWKNIDKDHEFRIFVHNNRITAISQQHLYCVNAWLMKLSENAIKDIILNIIEWFNVHISDKLSDFGNYVMDFAITEDGEYYFIEINSFGEHYSSGSALFHWLNDKKLLYGKCDYVEFRYVSE